MNATNPAPPIRLYRSALSGHCHRVELLLSLLGLPHELIDVNLAAREHKTPEFLALNPFGQIPVLQDGTLTLADSNAILIYLAQQYGEDSWLPATPAAAAETQRWFSLAAGPLAFGPAAARLAVQFHAPIDLPLAQSRAHALFAVMNEFLMRQDFLTGARVGLADLAHYAYVACAPEGGVALDDYPALRAWLARIEALPGFVPMKRIAQG
jgi:glutathione S-transferase